ncbi:MAG TPA: cupin domain-containing protein [Sedimentisphaerales bacterium]|jgi:mannose-6-phosphate isomerase-like protein (cupin superfamily)|nr:cupin domain-containing protein [Sedimentisphaerales bacterium]HNU29068.1 cupin domain-containing protein [Sedimentisphaerales bacterium]
MANYVVTHFDDIEAVKCPCGFAKRAFALPENSTATVHVVDIRRDSKVHYHKEHTEIYLVLEGEGYLELDGDRVPVRPFSTALIKPLCRHRAVGNLRIVNICIPPFDPADEWFDESSPGAAHL